MILEGGRNHIMAFSYFVQEISGVRQGNYGSQTERLAGTHVLVLLGSGAIIVISRTIGTRAFFTFDWGTHRPRAVDLPRDSCQVLLWSRPLPRGSVRAPFPRGFNRHINGTLYFVAGDFLHGDELWKSDGTAAGTVMVKDIAPPGSGSSGPEDLTNVSGTLYFEANDGSHGKELWKTNGTAQERSWSMTSAQAQQLRIPPI